ncbi:MAG: S1 RNA-binding domain-containing protein [Oscillospiraceae bacterium]|jgi:S1 RNA binding domain protein|nr:S1 RNA-binding domain-containing protein [Oscillospiraceae bacterium]
MQLKIGSVMEGKVSGITKFGAFVDMPDGKTGMVHISEISTTFVNEIRDYVTEGQLVRVKVVNITDTGKIGLSMKQVLDKPDKDVKTFCPKPRFNNKTSKPEINHGKKITNFEHMMSKFKQASEEKIYDLKKANESKRGEHSKKKLRTLSDNGF